MTGTALSVHVLRARTGFLYNLPFELLQQHCLQPHTAVHYLSNSVHCCFKRAAACTHQQQAIRSLHKSLIKEYAAVYMCLFCTCTHCYQNSSGCRLVVLVVIPLANRCGGSFMNFIIVSPLGSLASSIISCWFLGIF
jgi:hypothetical protein